MTAEQFLTLTCGYQVSQCVFVATQLGILDALCDGKTAASLLETVAIDPERARDVLDVLASVGVLERDGDRYRTAPEIAAVLDQNLPGLPGTVRSFVSHHAKYRYERWGHLLETVRTGRRPPYGSDGFSGFHETAESLAVNTKAMFEKSLVWGAALAEAVSFAERAIYLDVGGAAGAMAISVARRWPVLRCLSADLPRLEPLARKEIDAAGLAERVSFVAVDFLKDELPRADVVSFASVFHNWDARTRRTLADKTARALPPGGLLLVCENFIGDDRRDTEQLLGSLNMAVMTEGGAEFSVAQLTELIAPAGFTLSGVRPLARHARVAIYRRH